MNDCYTVSFIQELFRQDGRHLCMRVPWKIYWNKKKNQFFDILVSNLTFLKFQFLQYYYRYITLMENINLSHSIPSRNHIICYHVLCITHMVHRWTPLCKLILMHKSWFSVKKILLTCDILVILLLSYQCHSPQLCSKCSTLHAKLVIDPQTSCFKIGKR